MNNGDLGIWLCIDTALTYLDFTEQREGNLNMRRKFSVTLALLALIGLAPLLGACHTTAGAGQDLSAGGHAITNSAEKHAP